MNLGLYVNNHYRYQKQPPGRTFKNPQVFYYKTPGFSLRNPQVFHLKNPGVQYQKE